MVDYTAQQEKIRRQAYQQAKAQQDEVIEGERMKFIYAAEDAAGKNRRRGVPIPEKAFSQIVKIYNQEFDILKREVEKAYVNGTDRPTIVANVEASKQGMYMRMKDKLSKVHGGMDAWMEIGAEKQGGSLITSAIKKIYDSDKGGVQWGGLVGAVAGGLLVNTVTAGYGTLINTIATFLGIMSFSYLAGSFLDKPDSALEKPDYHTQTLARAKARHKANESAPVPQTNTVPNPPFIRNQTQRMQSALGDNAFPQNGLQMDAESIPQDEQAVPLNTPKITSNSKIKQTDRNASAAV